jgi:putative tryptophan/tyrosine transport system substrate-binding protein
MRRREFIAGVGATLAWPVVVRAQQRSVPVIGYLSSAREDGIEALTARFREGLGEQGYAEHRSIEILYRWAESEYNKLPALATDLVRRRVDLIVTTAGSSSALAAKSATATIPIVFEMGEDPVEAGLVANLNRPGGNITGATVLSGPLIGKRLELLHQMMPASTQIGLLANPTSPPSEAQIRQSEMTAHALGLHLVIQGASSPHEIEGGFTTLVARGIDALFVDNDPLFFVQRHQLVALAARYRMPTSYHAREFVQAGGLMSYSASFGEVYRLAGNYAGRILKGEKPGDLPVQLSARIDLGFSVQLQPVAAAT